MANFSGHIIGASIGSGVMAAGLLSLQMLSPTEATIAFVIGVIGGLLPDVDLDHSKPFKTGSQLFAIFLAFSTIFSKAVDYSLIEMAILWSVTYFLTIYLLSNVFTKYTRHRGMIHSVPAIFISGFLMVDLSYYFFDFNATISWLYGAFMMFGFTIHLILDEVVSMNIFGKKVKKSLGTAMKFYNKKDYYTTMATYMIAIFLVFTTPSSKDFRNIFLDIELFKSIGSIILPEGVWFENFIPKENSLKN